MDIMEKLKSDLDARMGYGEEVVVTREELRILLNGVPGELKEALGAIEDLEAECSELKDSLDHEETRAEEAEKEVEKLEGGMSLVDDIVRGDLDSEKKLEEIQAALKEFGYQLKMQKLKQRRNYVF